MRKLSFRSSVIELRLPTYVRLGTVNCTYMTNISKHKLPHKTEKQLFSQFTNLFIAADEKKLAVMFDALFTDAEKIMFIKRIAIILMLSKGVPMYGIAKSLKVSVTTVRSQRELLEEGRYEVIIIMTRKKNFDADEFFGALGAILRLGMPSYGKDRWKSLKM